jgi:hypothetical protein
MATTVDCCQGPTGGAGEADGAGSVTLMAFLGPGDSVIVVAVRLPESRLVVNEYTDP